MSLTQRRKDLPLALPAVDKKELPAGFKISRRGGAELRNGRALGALHGALRIGRHGAASCRKVRRIRYDKMRLSFPNGALR